MTRVRLSSSDLSRLNIRVIWGLKSLDAQAAAQRTESAGAVRFGAPGAAGLASVCLQRSASAHPAVCAQDSQPRCESEFQGTWSVFHNCLAFCSCSISSVN